MTKKVGVIGYSGNLGKALVQAGAIPLGINLDYVSSVERSLMLHADVDVVINCAAITDVDGIENNPRLFLNALNVNGMGIANLFNEVTQSVDIYHISTDYVFDGKNGPYSNEETQRNPVCKYGHTKLVGELVFEAASEDFGAGNHHIIRTTCLYGGERDDFVKKILKYYSENHSGDLQLPNNMFGNPTYIPALADDIIEMVTSEENLPPIIHLVGVDYVSRYDWAVRIAEKFNLNVARLQPKVFDLDKIHRPKFAGLVPTELSMLGAHNLDYGLSDMLGKMEGYIDY